MSPVRERARAFRACVRRREISRGSATAVRRKNASDGRLCFSRENEGSRGVRACARARAFGRALGRGSRGRFRASRPLRWRGAGARWSGRSANFVGGSLKQQRDTRKLTAQERSSRKLPILRFFLTGIALAEHKFRSILRRSFPRGTSNRARRQRISLADEANRAKGGLTGTN